MEKLNALFKSHRPRLTSGTTSAVHDLLKVKEPQHESKTKSAPCTPCGNHDLVFDVDSPGNFDHSSSKLNEQSCAVSTPKLTRSVHAGVSIQQRSLDRHRSRPAAVGCSPIELTRGHADDDVHPVTNDHCRRQRRHRTRERHRSATRIANGLDRSWEAHRVEGMEMLQHSVEMLKERQGRRQPSLPDRTVHATTRDHSKSRSDGNRCRVQSAEPFNLPDVRVCVERRLVELSRQLMEERQRSRQNRLNLAKLQQELARQKSEHPLREVLLKELERERLLRIEAENRLRNERLDVCDCKSQAAELQKDLARAQEFAHSLIPYKDKYEQLKEENSNTVVSYESQLEALRSDIGRLSEEKSCILADMSLLQKMCAGCKHCATRTADCRLSVSGTSHSDESCGGSEKTKVLLERMRKLEAEKTCLVLEAERQSEQYEKCLDDITSQVLQAVMAQRSLKVECCKLRARVVEVQQQNAELRHLFCDRARTQLGCEGVTAVDNLPEIEKKRWTETESLTSDMAVSFESIRSMCSDREQMQFLVSRLASPTVIDFDEDSRIDTLSVDDPTLSPRPHCTGPSVGDSTMNDVPNGPPLFGGHRQTFVAQQSDFAERVHHPVMSIARQQQYCSQKSCPTDCAETLCGASVSPTTNHRNCAAQQKSSVDRSFHPVDGKQVDRVDKSCVDGCGVLSDTGSTLSLNELLDGCRHETEAGDTTDDCDRQPNFSRHHSEIVNIVHVSVDAGPAHSGTVQQVPSGLDSRPGADDERNTHVAFVSLVQSPLMQRSFAESNLSSSSSSSEKAHVDDGYHSNATSAMSQEAAAYHELATMLSVT